MENLKSKKSQPIYRGSEWRKWNLHIHSPVSFSWTGPKEINGSIDNVYKEMIKKINKTDIDVFAITDYWTFDGYKKIIEINEIMKSEEKLRKKILPGIELRFDILTDRNKKSRVNFQIIFSDVGNKNEVFNRLDQFYSQLKLSSTDKIISQQSFIDIAKDYSDDVLEALVGKNKNECQEEDFLKAGYKSCYISYDCINKILKLKEFKGNALMVVPWDKYGGLSYIDPILRDDIKKKLTTLAKIIESTRNETIKLFLLDEELLRSKSWGSSWKQFLNEKEKPCICGSDSHNIDEIGQFANNKFCWIKADPTFEGLKQIIYEPQLRTHIGDRLPLYLYPQIISLQLREVEKYQTLEDKKEFPPINLKNKITFSPNLTTIIGPRASGKTVLVESLSYPFNKNKQPTEYKKGEKLPLIQFLEKRFPNLIVEVLYQYGEVESHIVERKVTDLLNPEYTSPLNIEYWPQGKIEEVADKKEKIAEYIKERLESDQLLNLSLEIDELKEKLKNLREKYLHRFEVKIKQKRLLAERKQIEEYFKKLKTQEYKNLVEKIQKNRAKTQLLDDFIDIIGKMTESLEEISDQFSFLKLPDEKTLLKLFTKTPPIYQKIEKLYKFVKIDIVGFISEFKVLKKTTEKSEERKILIDEATQLKSEFLDYCKKSGVKITKTEYEKRSTRLKTINRQLRELEARLKEYKMVKGNHDRFSQELSKKLTKWNQENKKVIEEFNKTYSQSNIRVVWEDPSEKLQEWVKEQFMASDSEIKPLIKKHFHISSPAREDFIKQIVTELIVDKKYSLEKIIKYLKEKRRPPVEESKGKEENLNWFFQRDKTDILREDLIIRLQEYGERGINLLQYGKKILGKHTMSFGERCGTLIELILYSGDHPLIIDQPEEHLDAKFIVDRVIEILREQKIDRQIIICTHNANITVLGDSELITVLTVDEQGTNSHQGSLENVKTREQIYNVLEGGLDAFRRRERKYGLLK